MLKIFRSITRRMNVNNVSTVCAEYTRDAAGLCFSLSIFFLSDVHSVRLQSRRRFLNLCVLQLFD